MPERLILCSGAKRAGGNSTLRLALSGRSQNITLKLEDISKKMVRNVPDLLIDLIEIATYVYCADQATSRGGPVQVGMGADWRRSFRFVIPVRNPDHWNHHSVFGDDGGGAAFKADEVVLFSGGLDSLGGAIEELSTNGKRVALVSHRSSPKIFDHQKHLVTELNTRFPTSAIGHW